jgi:DNA-binding NtrC family response regulator
MPAKNTEKREKILLIEEKWDAPLIGGLEQQGYEVITCESPQKAWGFVYPIRPHLIILHLEQPTGRDIYALQECRALADGVPVIVATGASEIDAFMRELGKGVLRFLSLPMKPNALREIRHELKSSSGDRRPENEWRNPF